MRLDISCNPKTPGEGSFVNATEPIHCAALMLASLRTVPTEKYADSRDIGVRLYIYIEIDPESASRPLNIGSSLLEECHTRFGASMVDENCELLAADMMSIIT